MQVFILGATGTIGSAVTRDLLARGHRVLGLCRSRDSANRLHAMGARSVVGDLARPAEWTDQAVSSDCAVQLAATFDGNMGSVDCGVLDALEHSARRARKTLHILYTGGCWLYGSTGDQVASESTPFNPIESFTWMVENASRLEQSRFFRTTILHPAMVYHRHGGAFSRYLGQAKRGETVEIWGSAKTRWPLIHRDDLAVAYRVLAEHPEMTGHYNVSAETGRETGVVATQIANHFGNGKTQVADPQTVLALHGAWAEGPMLDQQMSSRKLTATGLWKPRFSDFATTDVFT